MHENFTKDAVRLLLVLSCAVRSCTANAVAQDSIETSFLLKQIGVCDRPE
jgi:hypothetical protein